MKTIRKKIVTDEQMQPLAVQIAYADWLEIEQRLGLQTGEAACADDSFKRLLDDTKGIWTAGDGLAYQRRIREEWVRPWDPEAGEDA